MEQFSRKEKFAKEHKAELDEWNQADRFVRKNLPDQLFNAGALQTELSSLNAQLDELNSRLTLARVVIAVLTAAILLLIWLTAHLGTIPLMKVQKNY